MQLRCTAPTRGCRGLTAAPFEVTFPVPVGWAWLAAGGRLLPLFSGYDEVCVQSEEANEGEGVWGGVDDSAPFLRIALRDSANKEALRTRRQ